MNSGQKPIRQILLILGFGILLFDLACTKQQKVERPFVGASSDEESTLDVDDQPSENSLDSESVEKKSSEGKPTFEDGGGYDKTSEPNVSVKSTPSHAEESNILTLEAKSDHHFVEDLVEKNKVKLVGEEQIQAVCSAQGGSQSVVIVRFCTENFRPKNLKELMNGLGLNPAQGTPYVLTGHSSSLVARFTSAINPRMIMFSSSRRDPDFVALGFVRGEQFAEIASRDPASGAVEFFLLGFQQACNQEPHGCNYGQLLTDYIESNWTEVSLFSEENLANTIVDCRHCHEPEGRNSGKLLRMQELQDPWTHFFRNNRESRTLIDDFHAAHGTTGTYAGIDLAMIRNGGGGHSRSDPARLENFVRSNGGNVQPNEFRTSTISQEVNLSAGQPQSNQTEGESNAWQGHYEAHVNGEVIAPPYHDVKVTDPELLIKYTDQYRKFRQGSLPLEEFEDHRNVLKQDAKSVAKMGFGVLPDADGETIITQACSQCHNSKLDQSISRAKFNVDINEMVQNPEVDALEELEVAINRLTLGYTPSRLKTMQIVFQKSGKTVHFEKGEHIETMPPRRFKSLSDDQIDEAIRYLRAEMQKLSKDPAEK